MQRSHVRRVVGRATAGALVLLVLLAGVALALVMSNADGKWANAVSKGGGSTAVGCLRWGSATQWSTNVNTYQDSSTTDENQVRFGGIDNASDCSPNTSQSGLGFDGNDGPLTFSPGEVFLLGKFVHYNNPVYYSSANNTLASVDLSVTLNFAEPPGLNPVLGYNVLFDETANNADPCPYGDSTGNGCDDRVTLPASVPNQTFEIEGVPYTLQITGFVPDDDGVCPAAPAGATSNVYTTGERKTNYACLYGRIVLPIDSGDAPDIAGQTVGPNRARHNITAPGPYLGVLRGDGEVDGQPNAAATGDDIADSDDEDGLVSVSAPPWQAGGSAEVKVARGTAAGTDRACVYAWIDWAGDGFGIGADSTAQGERTAAGAGNLTLTFTNNLPPGGGFPAAAVLRLRVRSGAASCPALGSTGYEPTGLWPDGEVEDHLLNFGPNALTLSGFTAQTTRVDPVAAIPYAMSLLVLAGLVFFIRRRYALGM